METVGRERAILVQVIVGNVRRGESEESLAELERLADTAGAEVVGAISQRRDRPTSAFYVGEGKLADIQLACRQSGANLVVFDNELSPTQVNNVDLALGIRVIDRTELILQIFARRARSAEAKVQVELAQLQYLITRIPVSDKQARFRGGIGAKGPGESPLQLRNEPMRRRIRELKKAIEAIHDRRKLTRNRRRWPVVCLAGYTNAGKSTLLNAFTRAEVFADNRLFATLDTKTRLLRVAPGRNALLTDTVGFIRDLPHMLIASFKSTLDVAVEADALLVVADASHPCVTDQIRVVEETLVEIGAGTVPSILLLNKTDIPAAKEAIPLLMERYPKAVPVSALCHEGLHEVRRMLADKLPFVRPDDAVKLSAGES